MMKKTTLAVACSLAAAVAGCGGGGEASTVAASSTATSAAQTEFVVRAARQGDERVYEVVDKYNDVTLTYTARTVQTALNADRSGERQTFDVNNVVLQSLRYDGNGIRSVTFYPSGMTCSPGVSLNRFPDTLAVGQAIENKYTDSCSNGYAYKTEEKATIAGTETVQANRATYSAIRETATINIEAVPPAPGEHVKYAVTQTSWIDPVLGLAVKETADISYTAPPQGHYLVSSTRTLLSYVNK